MVTIVTRQGGTALTIAIDPAVNGYVGRLVVPLSHTTVEHLFVGSSRAGIRNVLLEEFKARLDEWVDEGTGPGD